MTQVDQLCPPQTTGSESLRDDSVAWSPSSDRRASRGNDSLGHPYSLGLLALAIIAVMAVLHGFGLDWSWSTFLSNIGF